jgi:DNA-binding PadR family transcriptional regulator
MSLEYAILGFLNYQPLSGYDLKKIFDTSVQQIGSPYQTQIYLTIPHLPKQTLIEAVIFEQPRRPDRKIYHITPLGKEALQAWLHGPIPLQDPRSAPLVQIFFSAQLSDQELIQRFEQISAFARATLERYDHVPQQAQPYIEKIDSARETFFWLLTLEMGIHSTRALLEWSESVLERLRNGQIPPR